MPREAKLFAASAGSAVRGFLKFRLNIPPRWMGNARTSRKRVEPEIAPPSMLGIVLYRFNIARDVVAGRLGFCYAENH